MPNPDRVQRVYQAEAKRTGSYITARALVIARFGLTPAQADHILAAGRRQA